MSFADSENPIVYWTAQQERFKTLLMARFTQVADFMIAEAQKQEKPKEWAPSHETYFVNVFFMGDILLPAHADVQMQFEHSFHRGHKFMFSKEHPGSTNRLEVVMGTTHMSYFSQGAQAFVGQCIRDLRIALEARYLDVFVYSEPAPEGTVLGNTIGLTIAMNVKIREPPVDECIAVCAVAGGNGF